MLKLIVIVLLALITVLAASLKKAYSHISANELKRRAAKDDKLAKTLYKAVAYGRSLDILLWIIIGLSSVSFFILVARSVPAWIAVLISLGLFWFGFAWLPNSRVTVLNEYSARFFTPLVAWLLRKLHPVLDNLARFVKDKTRFSVHSGIYDKEDLLDLLRNQKSQLDNRITKDELRIASGALKFGERLVSDVMTPRRMIKMVKASDSVGPVLMSELHDSGHSRFPVYEDKKDNLVGILYLRDLIETSSKGKASELMNPKVYYVNEELTLAHALQAFLKTKHHLFVVVNKFEEVVGIITIEDILEQIIGKPIVDEFDKYEDLRAVALLSAQEEKQEHKTEEAKETDKKVLTEEKAEDKVIE